MVEAPAGAGPLGRSSRTSIYSQQTEHRRFGGVVPEIAARAHLERIDGLIDHALARPASASTISTASPPPAGPGLIGGVMVGVMTAKAIALARDKPFLAVNHLEGHALSVRLAEPVDFPFLLLLVSGGHCQLLTVEGVGDFTRLGTTIDDAAGEAFDKTAKLLGLGFPGGPAVERGARTAMRSASPCRGRCGASRAATSPSPASRRRCARRSRSSIRTTSAPRADLCASFQRTVGDVLADRVRQRAACRRHRRRWSSPAVSPPTFICGPAGGRRPAARCASGCAAGDSAPTMPP